MGPRPLTPRPQVLQIDDDVLTTFVSDDLGNERSELAMRRHGPMTAGAAAYWRSVNDFVRERMRDGTADDPLIAASLQQLVLAAYLHVFPTTWADARTPRDGNRPAPAALQRAKTYIEEHAHQPVTVLDIARAARMSPRGLQAAFRREFDITPMTYLHTVRLAGARADLTEANPADGATVAGIAQRWGYAHPSRFSLRYREAYGESPSTTLRR